MGLRVWSVAVVCFAWIGEKFLNFISFSPNFSATFIKLAVQFNWGITPLGGVIEVAVVCFAWIATQHFGEIRPGDVFEVAVVCFAWIAALSHLAQSHTNKMRHPTVARWRIPP